MKTLLIILLLMLGGLASPDLAQARPGGGHSSSSSSFSHGSSGTGFSSDSHSGGFYAGGGAYTGDEHPMSSPFALIVLVILVIVIVIVLKNINQQQSFTASPTIANRNRQQDNIKEQLQLLKQRDANFSSILFLDFVHSLYSKFYSYSTHPEFSYLSPFLSAELQQHFLQAGQWTVNEVVINGIRWLEINTLGDGTESISVDIDANYTLRQQGKRSRYAVDERWQFYRQKGLLSAEPDKMQTLCCPHCGAPAHFTDAGVCEHCGSVVQKGGMQWYLGKRVVLKTSALASNDLVSYAEEEGTQLAEYQASRFKYEQMQSNFSSYMPSVTGKFFGNRLKPNSQSLFPDYLCSNGVSATGKPFDIYYQIGSMKPIAFWQALYAENDWYNRLDNLSIERVELVKIETDKFYEAITVRIFAVVTIIPKMPKAN